MPRQDASFRDSRTLLGFGEKAESVGLDEVAVMTWRKRIGIFKKGSLVLYFPRDFSLLILRCWSSVVSSVSLISVYLN